MSEQDKFLLWYEKEIEAGLIDIKFDIRSAIYDKNVTIEDFFREANLVNELYEQKNFVNRLDVF